VYESFYGLRVHPFSLVPDPAFLYLGRKHKVALSLLEYGLLNRSTFTVITGEPGTGKTTLLNTILDRSEREITLGVLSHTHAGLGSLLPWVLMAFGLDGKGMDSVELYRAFSNFLSQEHARHRQVVLVVDESQNLGPAMLEELRLLSNLNDGRRHTLQIILSGQPNLRRLLQGADLVQFAQRIAVDYHLEPFGEEETPEYIRHRLKVAGGPVTIMSDTACRVVHRLTGGNPRLINQICDVSLAYGFAEQAHHVTAQLVAKSAMDRAASKILPLAGIEVSGLVSEEERRNEQTQLNQWALPPAQPTGDRKPAAPAESAGALYKRGVAFKEAGAFRQAIAYFEEAEKDGDFFVKARTQIALCLRARGHMTSAVTALQKLWNCGQGTVQERRQVRYLLARTLEVSGRNEEALTHYHALREERSDYRDVSERLCRLSGQTESDMVASSRRSNSWTKFLSRGWEQLLRGSS
jgi:type II secretory pathway predicted ATPase ExeA